MSTRFIPCISRSWLVEELYGWRHAPSIAACRVPYVYAKAMLYAAGAGPSKAQYRDYVTGMLSAHLAGGMDADLLQFVNHFDRASQISAPEFSAAVGVRRLPTVNARVIVYDAVSTAIADGALDGDAASDVTAVAKELGVTAKCARRIASLCEREATLLAKRRSLLLGDERSPLA
jgi:hypothetical protein